MLCVVMMTAVIQNSRAKTAVGDSQLGETYCYDFVV